MMHVVFLTSSDIYLFYRAQVALLIQNKVFMVILSEYTNNTDILLPYLVVKLSEYIEINNYYIDLV